MVIEAPGFSVWFTMLLLVGLGGGLLVTLTGAAARDSRLTMVILASYGLRVGLALAMFYISLWGWPVLRSQQYSHGFWQFSVDSTTYHLYGSGIANAWEKGTELPDPQLNTTYFFVVGLLYKLLGPHPIYPALLNGILASLVAVLAYAIGRRLFNHEAGLLSAVLVGFWPSSLLWATQVLKDPLSWLLGFSIFWLLFALTPDREPGIRSGAVRIAGLCVLLGGVVSLLTLLRPYMGSLIAVATLLVFAPKGGLALMKRRVGHGARCGLILLVVVASFLMGRTWNLFRVLSPPHPDVAHFRLALQHAQRGEVSRAAGGFYRATELNPEYVEAYRGRVATSIELGTMHAAERRLPEATNSYTDAVKNCMTLLRLERDPRQQAVLREIVGRLQFEIAVSWWLRGRRDYALAEYEQALAFHPALSSEFGDFRSFMIGLPPAQKTTVSEERAPVAEERAPVAEGRAPVAEGRAPVAEGRAPVAEGRAPVSEERAPVAEEKASVAEKRTPVSKARARARVPVSRRMGQLGSLATQLLPVRTMPSRETVQSNRYDPLIEQLQPGEAVAAPGARRTTGVENLMESVTRLDDEALLVASEMTSESLGSRRQGFVDSGGYSLMDAWAKISTPRGMITYLPRALMIGFLAPFPTQWFDTRGSTGVMRALASADMILLYLLLPAIFLGGWRLIKARRPEGLVLLAFILLTASGMSLVVANLGTLFRTRLQFLLLMLVVASGGVPAVIRAIRPLVARRQEGSDPVR